VPSRVRSVHENLRVLFVAVALAIPSGALVGCDLSFQNSRMARGQLAQVGLDPYDDYFKKVHAEQVSGAAWADERKENRKSLVTTLGLLPDASGEVISAAVQDRAKTQGTASVAGVVDSVAKAELARAERIEARAPVLEDLANQGDDLRPRVARDFPRDSSKRRDADNELAGAAHELRHLAITARTHAREARRFAADLGQAVGVTYAPKPGASAPAPEPTQAPSASASAAPSASASAAPAPKKPRVPSNPRPVEPKPETKPEPKPEAKPEPKPDPKPSGEVFTP
jgi:hypothetical protein